MEKKELMLTRLITLLCLLCLCPGLQAGVIYQWVDDTGRTQISDVVPAKYQSSAKQLGSTNTAQPMQSQEEAQQARERTRAAGNTAATSRRQNNMPAEHGSSTNEADTAGDCAALQRAYQESLICFGRYRGADNSMDPHAFNVCKEAPDPSSRCATAPNR
ncbi:MAG: DUF4124 domain-containing protein [Moraxellaceae bacterium]